MTLLGAAAATLAATPPSARAVREVRVSASTRALVISPHPDDGALGAGGLIQRIVARHGSVDVVEMTSGDAFPNGVKAVRRVEVPTPGAYRWYGQVREAEAYRAMARLGLARSRVRLLGFPDEGLCQLADTRAADHVFASPYTHRESPPPQEQLRLGAKYRGADARQELEDLLVAFRPNVLVIPDARDEHPDHCSTHLLIHRAIEGAGRRGVRAPKVLHYLIHYRKWPTDPIAFPAQLRFEALRLSDAERSAKRDAIRAYRTQVKVMPDFLAGFAGAEERFIVDDDDTPAACWCSGTNIAQAPATGR